MNKVNCVSFLHDSGATIAMSATSCMNGTILALSIAKASQTILFTIRVTVPVFFCIHILAFDKYLPLPSSVWKLNLNLKAHTRLLITPLLSWSWAQLSLSILDPVYSFWLGNAFNWSASVHNCFEKACGETVKLPKSLSASSGKSFQHPEENSAKSQSYNNISKKYNLFHYIK